MATNDVLGKLGRSNIKSQGPLLWAEKQPNGSIREVLFLSFALSLAPSLKKGKNKWKLICIKCLSRQTCPLGVITLKYLIQLDVNDRGGDKVGCVCISVRVCVVLINGVIASLNVLSHVFVYFLTLKQETCWCVCAVGVCMQQDWKVGAEKARKWGRLAISGPQSRSNSVSTA